MPDPNWTANYNVQQTPEQNGFTRVPQNNPVITLVQTGPQGSRGVRIVTAAATFDVDGNLLTPASDCAFFTNDVPALSEAIGVTAEALMSTTGPGDAGFELDFLGITLQCQLFTDKVRLYYGGAVWDDIPISPPSSADTTMRVTYGGGDGDRLKVYRNGTLILDKPDPPKLKLPFQRVVWWGESGGTQMFKTLKYFQGGPVPPG